MSNTHTASDNSRFAPQTLIDFTIGLLNRLRDVVTTELPPNASPEMKKQMKEIQKLTESSIQELQHPTLRLAFVGATSSGKSTVVNALVGHRILPMETGEMSAGIVRVHHDSTATEEMRLQLSEPLKSGKSMQGNKVPWSAIDKTFKQDCDMYNPLAKCMKSYHDARKKMENLQAPQADMWCNTYIGENKDLLNLPDGINLEILDLPGIREVNDATNLNAVQQILGKNVLTLVLSYDDTAEERLNGLLEEIRDIVEAFKGDTSTLLFVLNKMDRWTPNDGTKQSKIEELATKIKDLLKLKGKPVILPMCAQKFMLPQVSKGKTNHQNISDNDSLMLFAESVAKIPLSINDDWYLDDLLGPCLRIYNEIERVRSKDTNAKVNLHDGDKLERSVTKIQKILSEEDNRIETLLQSAQDESGVKDYLATLRNRIENHFARLIIQPALGKLLAITEEYIKQMKGECALNIEKNVKDLELLRKELEQTQHEIEQHLKETNDAIEKEKDIILDHLASAEMSKRTKLIDFLQGKSQINGRTCKYLMSIEGIFKIIDKIKSDASDKIQKNIQKYFDSGIAIGQQLTDNGITPYTVNDFVEKLATLSRHFANYGSNIKLEMNQTNKNLIDKIVEDYTNCLAMFPKVIGDYLQFALQSKVQDFEFTLVDATQKIRREIIDSIKNKIGDKTIANSIVPNFEFLAQSIDMKFNASKLPISSKQLPSGTVDVTKYDYRDRTWAEWVGTWFGDKTPRKVAVPYNVEYITLELGTSKDLLREMATIIQNASDAISMSISQWFQESSNQITGLIVSQSKETLDRYKNICETRHKEAKEDTHNKQVAWQNYLKNLEEVLDKEKKERDDILFKFEDVIANGYKALPKEEHVPPRTTRTIDGEESTPNITIPNPVRRGRGQRTLD